jgi:hypothetical protein
LKHQWVAALFLFFILWAALAEKQTKHILQAGVLKSAAHTTDFHLNFRCNQDSNDLTFTSSGICLAHLI